MVSMRGDHVGKRSNRWRAPVRATWGANLGHFQAESVLGPKMKFVAHELLYIFHLETKVIRALQQRVIKPQIASVSALITVTEIHFRRSKLGQTQCNFLHALLHSITFNFSFWTNSSCLMNFGERGMPTAMTMDSRLRKFSKY